MRGDRVRGGGRIDSLPVVKSMSNVRSDTEELYDVLSETVAFTLDAMQDDKSSDRTIHSGHFMVSHIHEDDSTDECRVNGVKDDVTDDESDGDLVDCPSSTTSSSVAVAVACVSGSLDRAITDDKNSTSLAIDSSLTKLFECMTLAYSGKLKTPKWKNFKKIRIGLKDKIRLNNLIWREWHMQYKKGRAPVGCQFVTRIPENPHSGREAADQMVRYWKERLQKLVCEYFTWQPLLHKKLGQFIDDTHSDLMGTKKAVSMQWCMPADDLLVSDDFLMDLSDTLFSSLNTTNTSMLTKDLYLLGSITADVMQPDLVPIVPVQPSLEDFMDTLDAPVIRSGVPKPINFQPAVNWVSDVVDNRSLVVTDISDCVTQTTEQQPKLETVAKDVFNDENDDNSCDRATSAVLFEAGATQDLFNTDDTPLYDDNGEVDEQLFGGVDDSGSLEQLFSGILSQCPQQEPLTVKRSINKGNDALIREQQNISASATHTLSFGSSEEVLAMLENQLTHDGATFTRHSSPPSTDLVSLAFSDDVLHHLLLMMMRDGTTTGHQVHTLPSIAETPPSAAILPSNLVTLQPVIQVVQGGVQSQHENLSNVMKVEPGGHSGEGKPTQSLDNLYRVLVENSSSGGCRRASTGSLNQPVPGATFRMPQTAAAITNSRQCHQPVTETVTCCKRTILPRPSSLNQSQEDGSSSSSLRYLTALQHGNDCAPAVAAVANTTLQRVASSDKTLLSRSRSSGTVVQTAGSVPVRARSSGTMSSAVGQSSQRRNSFLEQLLTQETSSTAIQHPPECTPSRTRHKSDQSRSVGVFHSTNSNPTVPVNVPDTRGANAVFQPINPIAAVINSQNRLSVNQAAEGNNTNSQLSQHKGSLTKVCKVMNLQQAALPSLTSSSPLPIPDNPQIVALRSPSSEPTGLHWSNQQISIRTRHASSDSATNRSQQVSRDQQQEQRRENRRVSHITAEQRRRGNIKNGFDVLNQLIPSLSQSTNVKISKATTLLKAAEMFRRLKQERDQMVLEAEQLKDQIRMFDAAIRSCQSQLPASGVTPNVSRHHVQQSHQRIENYIAARIVVNWKFWIFGNIVRSLFDSYDNSVSTASIDDMCRTLLEWQKEHCSLTSLRHVVTDSLRQLSMTTSILTNPMDVPNQLTQVARDQLAALR